MNKWLYLLFLFVIIGTLISCQRSKITFDIAFDSNGGSEVASIIYDGKDTISLPNNPIKDGFIFDGWYWDNGTFLRPFTANSLLETPIKDDLTVYAKWLVQDDELTLQLKSIYSLAIQVNAFQGTYEDWLETVRGPQGVPGIDGRSTELRIEGTKLQWKYTTDTQWIVLFDLATLQGRDGLDGSEIILQVSDGYIQWKYRTDSAWTNLISLVNLIGPAGQDGNDGTPAKEIILQVSNGHIQWQYQGDTQWTNLVSLTTLTGADGSHGIDGKEVTFRVSDGYIQWQYIGDIEWTNLVSLTTLTGADGSHGIDGKEVTFRVSDGHIQWQYIGDIEWSNLVSLSTLMGSDGTDGIAGEDGKEVSLRVADGYIQWQYIGDIEWLNLVSLVTLTGSNGIDGIAGEDGKEVLLRVADSYIQWQHIGDTEWSNLISLSTLMGSNGADGKEVSLRVADGFIQWQYMGDLHWVNLIMLESLRGPIGPSGESVIMQVADGFIQWKYSGQSTWFNLVSLETLTGSEGTSGIDGREVTFRVYDGFIEWQYIGDSNWAGLVMLESLRGPIGPSGESVNMQVADGFIQWKYSGQSTWYNLVSLEMLTGSTGAPGIDGKEVTFRVSDGHIQWQYIGDTQWANLVSLDTLMGSDGADGIAGEDGKEVSLRVADGYIQWQYIGDIEWLNLVSLATLTGSDGIDGREVLFQVFEGYIQWQYAGDSLWTNMIEIQTLVGPKGEDGVGISSTEINQYGELIIHFTDGSSSNLGIIAVLYLVQFKDPSGYVFDVQSIIYGQAAHEPTPPNISGYDFIGWDKNFDVITSHLVVQAIYEIKKLTVTFDTQGGLPVDEMTDIIYGSTITLVIPTHPGYIFLGWFYGLSVNDGQFTTTSVVTTNLTLYARWAVSVVTVKFIDYNGTLLKEMILETGSDAIPPVVPHREGYTFVGWDKSYTSMVENTIIKAQYNINSYTFTFNSNEGSLVSNITQDYGTPLSEPSAPTKIGYTFEGWYYDQELTQIYIFTTMPAEDMTLYAKWSINQYTISFETNGGFDVPSITQDYGTSVTEPLAPIKEGHTFINWYSDQELTQVYMFTTMPAEDITVYVKWSINQYTITFESNGGSLVSPITQDYNTYIIEPLVLTKEGHTFSGWYWDIELIMIFDFSIYTVPAEDMTLYAKWSVNQYTITFETNGGSLVSAITQDYGTSVNEPLESFKEGYTFVGWFSDPLLTQTYLFTTMPAEDITLYAQWSINSYDISYQLIEQDNPYNLPLNAGEKIIMSSLSVNHSSALTSNGRLFTWGNNAYGQLGDGTTTDRILVAEITDQFTLNPGEMLIKVFLGLYHSSALTSEGRLFTWGYNGMGQLGNGTTIDQLTPQDITDGFGLSTSEVIIDVTLGQHYSAAVTSEGRLFTWGWGNTGQIGDGFTLSRSTPTDITAGFNLTVGEKISQVSLGFYHSAAVTSEGRLFTWGYNAIGLLGDGTLIDAPTPIDITHQFGLASGETMTNVSLGSDHTMALSSEGRLFTWGSNNKGQLGYGTYISSIIPIEITNHFNFTLGEKITSIASKGATSMALSTENRLFTWGWNTFGQLGDGTYDNRLYPTDITDGFELNIGETINFATISDVTASAITSFGRLFMWGINDLGQLGSGPEEGRPLPDESGFYYDTTILTIETYVYGSVTTGLTPLRTGYTFSGWYLDTQTMMPYVFGTMPAEDVTLYGYWIANQYTITFETNGGSSISAITQDFGTSVNEPLDPIKEGYSLNNWYSDPELTQVYVFTTMPAEDITLYAQWSINQYTITFESNEGSIVPSITQDYDTLVTEPNSPTREGYTFIGWYVDIALSEIYIFSTMPAEDIILYAKWSVNQYTINFESNGGSLVSAITQDYGTSVSEPVAPTKEGYTLMAWYLDIELTQLYTFTTMSAENITLYAKWELNTYSVNYFFMDQDIVSDLPLNPGETIIQISNGVFHSSALTSHGRLFTWGVNNNGQLGDGTGVQKSNLTEITHMFVLNPGETIIQISMGGYHSSALTSHGRVFTWGGNTSGQLGNNQTFNLWEPTDITGHFNLEVGETVTYLSMGVLHSSAITSLGRLFMWGDNSYGQLGNNSTIHSSLPIDITNQFNLAVDEEIIDVSLGQFHSSALTSLGRVFTWGRNHFNQLGNGTSIDQFTPFDITSGFSLAIDESIIKVELGGVNSSAITSSGRLFTWGFGAYGQIGDGMTSHRSTPTNITSGFNLGVEEKIVSTTIGDSHSSALTSTGRIFTWGYNNYGQLGDGTNTNIKVPKETTDHFDLALGETIIKVSSGRNHQSAITSSGRLFTWGYNNNGQLGNGTTTNALSPYEINLYSATLWNQTNYLYGETIIAETPTLEGYVFSGWYSNIYLTEPYVFSTMPAENINLFGYWIPN